MADERLKTDKLFQKWKKEQFVVVNKKENIDKINDQLKTVSKNKANKS